MVANIQFERQEVSLSGPVDISLKDVKVDGEWITGTVHVHAEIIGQKLDEDIPFKTKNSVEQGIDIALGAKVFVKATLKDPHQVCGEARLEWGPIKASTGEQCVNV